MFLFFFFFSILIQTRGWKSIHRTFVPDLFFLPNKDLPCQGKGWLQGIKSLHLQLHDPWKWMAGHHSHLLDNVGSCETARQNEPSVQEYRNLARTRTRNKKQNKEKNVNDHVTPTSFTVKGMYTWLVSQLILLFPHWHSMNLDDDNNKIFMMPTLLYLLPLLFGKKKEKTWRLSIWIV